jgi:hypothetical protein
MVARNVSSCWGIWPSTFASPVEGVLSPTSSFNSVVFPAPLGPTSATGRNRQRAVLERPRRAVTLAQSCREDCRCVVFRHAVLSISELDNVERRSDSIDSSSRPSLRAVRTQRSRLRARRACTAGGGPAGRRDTNVPTP